MESIRCLRVVFVRHGMTSWNQDKRYLGHSDEPIIEQEMESYQSLKKFFLTNPPDIVYSSDLLRCKQTAAFLFSERKTIIDQRLRELNFGSWEGKTYDDLKGNPTYRQWIDNWEKMSPPNGENGQDFKKRVREFWDDCIKSKANSIAIVTHGGVIRQLISDLVHTVSYWDLNIPFGKGYELTLVKAGEEWTCSLLSVVPTAEKDDL
ncbi:histidine phosphatase family protein [Peribacillus tepidiphilus]|uniref:histidine phosphatase family protein n=1 Tax=Peribacillus tepidiphilus TaxID=2652445 RepID=UPI0035B4FF04